MEVVSTIARYRLGFLFGVFGLNGFLQFTPMPYAPLLTTQFMGILTESH
jgi:hypothetical protein